MKKLFLILFLLGCNVYAQDIITIEAFVLDANTGRPIEFVNVGFIDRGIGTVTDINGKFTLRYEESQISPSDILQFSMLGYTSKSMQASELFDVFGDSNKVKLSPSRYDLDEVVLSERNYKKMVVGNTNISEANIGVWKDRDALGGEIGTRVRIKNENTRLKNLTFRVVENISDSLIIRVNVYDYKRGMPGENLLTRNILHTIEERTGEISIPLSPYNIVVDDDIVVSIELLRVSGLQIGFAVAASFGKGMAFTRTLSQDKWNKNSEIGMGFVLEAKVPAEENGESKKKETPNTIVLYWDSSTPMEQRQLDKELDLLSAYLDELKEVNLTVIPFSYIPLDPQSFQIENGNSRSLRTYLSSLPYEGAANFDGILKINSTEADIALLFSSGNTLLEPLLPTLNIPVFSINSLAEADHYQLQEAAFITDGHYINLTKTSQKEAIQQLLFEMDDNFDYEKEAIVSPSTVVRGKVTTPNGAAQGAQVGVEGTFIETRTDLGGNYQIAAQDGDVLIFEYLGMLPTKKRVNDQTQLDVVLAPDGELLEEVFIAAQKRKKETIETAFGKKNRDAIGLSGDQILAEEIGSQYQSLDQIIVRLPGVIVSGFGDNRRFAFARNLGSSISVNTLPVLIVNDIVYSQENAPFIDVQDIESITTLKSIMATNRYGNIAAGGAISIKTKSGNVKGTARTKPASLLVEGNNYADQLVPIVAPPEPSYLKQLKTATSYEEAKKIYTVQKQQLEPSIPFYISVARYFEKWDPAYAALIRSNIASLAKMNVKALLSLAFTYEAEGDALSALSIYEHILKLQPARSQAYRDVARLLVEVGRYQEAFEYYKQILVDETEGVDFSGIKEVAETEIKNLVALHKSKVSYEDLPNSLLRSSFKQDIRMVFEWTDPKAEFEVQFVNPDKKYFTYTHTIFDTNERLMEEITKGFSLEQFLIDDAPSGMWIVNATYLGDESLKNPTYLKYTLYRNYGLPSQTKTVKVIELFAQKNKVTIDRFLN